jgi:endonuclease/exonuclease/phosphatase family metal-dependent hydrolase
MLRVLEAGSVILFYLQALRVVFSVLFGIIYDRVFLGPLDLWLPGSVLLVTGCLLLPAVSPENPGRRWLAWAAVMVAAGRLGLSINHPEVRFWSGCLVLAGGGAYLAGLLTARRQLAFPALILALGTEQLLAGLGHSYDISLRPGFLPLQVVWSAGLISAAIVLAQRSRAGDSRAQRLSPLTGLGLGAYLFLTTSLLNLPHAISRWSQASYAVMAPLLIALTLVWLLPRFRRQLTRGAFESFALRLVLGLALISGLLVGYHLHGFASAVALLIAHVSAMGFTACLLEGRAQRGLPAGPMIALGLGLFLAFQFLNAFAFTYPYTLPVLREKGWAIYLLAAGVLASGYLIQPAALSHRPGPPFREMVVLPLLFGAVTAVLISVQPPEVPALRTDGTLRLATWNIHYGYEAGWRYTLLEQAQAIEAAGVDLIVLQEVDAGRMTSYSVDNALFLAYQLKMHAVYLPTVEHLTGIAVLYRGIPGAVDRRLLSSRQEQTGILRLDLPASEGHLSAFGVWLGLSDEDTLRQMDEALAFIGDAAPASFAGDFNATDDSELIQRVLAAGFTDPFQALGMSPPPTDPAVEPERRIDYIWLRQITPLEAWVDDSLASDHRMVVVEIALAQ